MLSVPRLVGVVLLVAFVLDMRLWPWKMPLAFLPFAAFFIVFTVTMLRGSLSNFIVMFQQVQLFLLFIICYNLFFGARG